MWGLKPWGTGHMADQANLTAFRLRHNLAALLRARGMTAAELSRKTGVAKQVLSDWIAGVQPRKLEQLYVVARTLGVSMEELCFATPESDLVGSLLGKSIDDGISRAQVTGAGATGSDGIHELKGRYEVYLRRLTE